MDTRTACSRTSLGFSHTLSPLPPPPPPQTSTLFAFSTSNRQPFPLSSSPSYFSLPSLSPFLFPPSPYWCLVFSACLLGKSINLNDSWCGPQTADLRSVDAQPISRTLTATVSWLTHSCSDDGCDRIGMFLVLIRSLWYTVIDWGEIKSAPPESTVPNEPLALSLFPPPRPDHLDLPTARFSVLESPLPPSFRWFGLGHLHHLSLGRIFTFLPNAIGCLTTPSPNTKPPPPAAAEPHQTRSAASIRLSHLPQAYEIRSYSDAIRPLATASASA